MSLHFDDGTMEENRPLVAGRYAYREAEDLRTDAPSVRVSVHAGDYTTHADIKSDNQSSVLRSLGTALTNAGLSVAGALATASHLINQATTSASHKGFTSTSSSFDRNLSEPAIELHTERSLQRLPLYTSDDGYIDIGDDELEDGEERPPTPEELFWGFCRNGDCEGLSKFLKDYCLEQRSRSYHRSSRDALVKLFTSQDKRRKPNELARRAGGQMNTGVHYACERGHLSILEFLHREYRNCIEWRSLRNKHESTPLHIAAAFGHSKMVKFILDECLRPPVLDADDIVMSVGNGNNAMIPSSSFYNGNDVVGDEDSSDNNNAEEERRRRRAGSAGDDYTCIVSKQPSMVSASRSSGSGSGNSSSSYSSSSDSSHSGISIRRKSDNPLAVFNDMRNTPLHCAVYGGHKETVRILLRSCDDPLRELHRPNGVRMTPLHYGEQKSMKAFIKKFGLEEFDFEGQIRALQRKYQKR